MKRSWLLVLVSFAAGALAAAGVVGWKARTGTAHESPEAAAAQYYCPMHPSYVSDRPGDCPICDMRLVRREREPEAPASEDPHAAHEGPTVAGYATVNVPAHKQQYIGVKTDVVRRHRLELAVDAPGRVAHDEARVAWVNTKVGGWIEVLHVDQTGQHVRQGQPLLEIYSPDLVATQEEYLIARENLERLETGGALAGAVGQARALVAHARRRLELWDIGSDQIQALEERGQISRRMTLTAPVGGFVVEKTALAGLYASPGENLYRIADHSKVWVLAEIFEQEASLVRAGQAAEVRLPYTPGRSYRGRVDYVYPHLDPATRTVRVRIVVPNPDHSLRPDMYTTVRFAFSPSEELLAVPNEAILDTGERRIVFVHKGDGAFEPRELLVGLRTREYTEVKRGLEEGERVVVSGNFLIDSESRLQAALAGMGAAGVHRH